MPRVSIGMVLYNDDRYLKETLSSLLAQTYTDFKLVMCDDCSLDDTGGIAKGLALSDSRLEYHQNERRLGLAKNSRRVFELLAPTEYFCWVAGHDVYHPRWLEEMVRVLDKDKNVVMAHSLVTRISENGEDLHIPSPELDTVDMTSSARIHAVVYEAIGYGNMIYGLFRSKSLKAVGVFPDALLPDMLLISKLSVLGSFHQVRERLWFRRFGFKLGTVDFVERQKNTVFSKAPWHTSLPWQYAYSYFLARDMMFGRNAGILWRRRDAFRLLTQFLKRRWRQMLPRLRLRDRISKIPFFRRLYRAIVSQTSRPTSLTQQEINGNPEENDQKYDTKVAGKKGAITK